MTSNNQTSSTNELQNIEDVYYKIVNVQAGEPGFDTWFSGPYAAAVDTYLNSAAYKDRSSLPDWNTFVTNVANIAGVSTTAIEDEFVKGYRFALFTDTNRQTIDVNSSPGEDFQTLTDAGVVDSSNIKSQFIDAFNALMANFPADARGGTDTPVSSGEFKNVFDNFFARSSLIENSSLTDLPAELTQYFNEQLVGSYEELFNTFYPIKDMSASDKRALFDQLLVMFAKEEIAKNGYFIPTQSFQDWGSFIEQSAKLRIFGQHTSLESMGASKVLILDDIFLLLAQMTDTLQTVAAVQSDRLGTLSEWQKAYTEQIDQIPVFVSGDSTYYGQVDPADSNSDLAKEFADDRSELNALNTSYKENLTAHRQVISDDSKSLQSSINQSTDAVTQQANRASSILEQLSTLLSSIFR